MFILEVLVTILYFLVIILVIVLALALAIPLGILFFVYWLFFKSWRRSDKDNEVIVGKSKINPKDIRSFVRKTIKDKKDNADSVDLKNENNEYVEEVIESSNIKKRNEED